MSKYKRFFISFISIAIITFTVFESKAQDPDVKTLIEQASADTQGGAIFGYTYFMRFSYNRHKKLGFGRKFSRLYEAVIPNRFTLRKNYRHPFVLLEDSERRLTYHDIAEMRNSLIRELERAEIEAENDANNPPERKDGGYWTMSFSENGKFIKIDILKLLENADFSELRKTEIAGRKAFVLDFVPKSGAKLEASLSYLDKIEGRIWIDEADKRIVRIEGFPVGAFVTNREKPDAERGEQSVFLFVQTRVREGFWFPQEVILNFTKHPEVFETVKVSFSFWDYKKASVEVRADEIKAPDNNESEVSN